MIRERPLHSRGKSATLPSRRQAPEKAAVMDALSSPGILLFGLFLCFDRRGRLPPCQ